MKCPECEGKGFKEYEHGLVMVGCEVCNGTGEIALTEGVEIPSKPVGTEYGSIPGFIKIDEPHFGIRDNEPRLEGEISIGEVVELKEGEERLDVVVELTSEGAERLKEVGILNDSNSRTERDNQPIGSTDTSQPKRTRKPKAKKRARKGTS